VQIGRLPPDDDHPYGHGKFEAIGSLFLALTLLGTGLSVGAVSNKKLIEIISIQRSAGIHGLTALALQIPTFPALFMAAVSILSKEWLYRITRNVGEELNSQVVIANAWHHRSDAYSSVLALISIGMAMYIPGFLAADAAAGILVAGMICMTGAEILGESIKQLTDTSNPGLVEKVTAIATQQQDVSSVNRVRARQVGSSSIIDVSVSMPEDLASSAARAIEEELKAKILQQDGVVDVLVRATSPGVVCPLLEATNVRPTASEVERLVREEILLKHPQVTSVEGVTVHYQDTLLVNVDVDIRVDGQVTMVRAKNMANDIRNSLESADQIHKANIFLDLNEGVAAMLGVNVMP
jgi:cation diffusion facilitator family transporter